MGKETKPATQHFDPIYVFQEGQTIKNFVKYINDTYSSPFQRSVGLIKSGKKEILGSLVVHSSFPGEAAYASQAKIVILAEKPGCPKRYNAFLEDFVKFSDVIRELQRQYDLPCDAASEFNFAEVQDGLRVDSVSCEVVYFPVCFLAKSGKTSDVDAIPELFLKLSQAFLHLQVTEGTPLRPHAVNADDEDEQPTSCLSRLFCCFS